MIPVPPLVAAKLALYTAMREQGMSEAELARRLGVTQKVVQSLLHLKRRTHSAISSGRWRSSASTSR